MDDSRNMPPPADSGTGVTAPVLDHLVGTHQGTRQAFSAASLRIGTAGDAAIRFPADHPAVATHHATLIRQGAHYLLAAEPGRYVEVNGEPVTSRRLVDGDTIRIGAEGPVVRFRLYEEGRTPYKSIPEAFRDCVDCARLGSEAWPGRAGLFLKAMPRELFVQTSPWSRGAIVLLLALLVTTTGLLLVRTSRLEAQLARHAQGVQAVTGLLEQAEENALSLDALRAVRAELESRLSGAVERVEALEARSDAGQRVIAAAAKSVVFLQGSYGFVDREDGRPLRMVLGPNGRPVTDAQGNPMLSFSDTGPVFERLFTGTAFVATEDGLLLTNAHVAVPWQFEDPAKALVQRGLIPVMHRQIGYLPGIEAPFDVELVVASETADVAVLRCSGATGLVPSLPLGETPARPGDEVFVLGYPTGIRALLARTNAAFVDSLMRDPRPDFWTMAQQLSEAGHIAPLATRGIVGQATLDKVVYDAETTHGGSGGPVLGLNGEVQAINAAILTDFGGSNLGIPAAAARRLLDQVIAQSTP